MTRIVVRFFGPAREQTATREISLELKQGQTVGDAAGILAERYPKLGAALGLRLAVNRHYVALDHVLVDGDEIAVIPPVSGGSESPPVRLTREPIEVAPLLQEPGSTEAGAQIVFLGVVRPEQAEGKTLVALDYHAYEEMAMDQLQAIHKKACKRFEILAATIVHRLGRISLGETSMAIVVHSAHRVAAFEACQWIVDVIKQDVPIWKKDLWADGSENWVDPTCS